MPAPRSPRRWANLEQGLICRGYLDFVDCLAHCPGDEPLRCWFETKEELNRKIRADDGAKITLARYHARLWRGAV